MVKELQILQIHHFTKVSRGRRVLGDLTNCALNLSERFESVKNFTKTGASAGDMEDVDNEYHNEGVSMLYFCVYSF